MKLLAATIVSIVLFIPFTEARVGGRIITPDNLFSAKYTYTVEKTDLGDRVALMITAKPKIPYDKSSKNENVEGRLSIGHHDSVIVHKEVKDDGTLIFKFNMAKADICNSRFYVGYTNILKFGDEKVTGGYLDIIELKLF